MVALSAGQVVLVSFPFSNLSQSRLRPAICLIADAGRGDWVLCQVPSNPYGDAGAVPLDKTISRRAGARTKLRAPWKAIHGARRVDHTKRRCAHASRVPACAICCAEIDSRHGISLTAR